VPDSSFIFHNKLFDLIFEGSRFFEAETYFTLSFAWPYQGTIEGLRAQVGCEKGDGIEAQRSCGVDCLSQAAMICLLDCGTAGDRHGRIVMTDSGDAFMDEIVGSTNATDGIVNLLGAIEGDDDVIEVGRDFLCSFMQEKTRGQEGEVNLLIAKEVAERTKIIM
jgi:hypothetical protein